MENEMNQELNVQVGKALGHPFVSNYSGDPTTFFKYVVPEIRKQGYTLNTHFFKNYVGDEIVQIRMESEEQRKRFVEHSEIATEAGCKAFLKMMEERK